MKFYETHYEEYISALQNMNMHPELVDTCEKIPKNVNNISNLIVFGPAGVGKYTQVLNILKNYSHSLLKYDKKIKIHTNKYLPVSYKTETSYHKILEYLQEIDGKLSGYKDNHSYILKYF